MTGMNPKSNCRTPNCARTTEIVAYAVSIALTAVVLLTIVVLCPEMDKAGWTTDHGRAVAQRFDAFQC